MDNEIQKTIEVLKNKFQGKEFLTKQEVASYLGISIAGVSNFIQKKKYALNAYKFGDNKRSSVRIKIEDLAIFLNQIVKNKRIFNDNSND